MWDLFYKRLSRISSQCIWRASAPETAFRLMTDYWSKWSSPNPQPRFGWFHFSQATTRFWISTIIITTSPPSQGNSIESGKGHDVVGTFHLMEIRLKNITTNVHPKDNLNLSAHEFFKSDIQHGQRSRSSNGWCKQLAWTQIKGKSLGLTGWKWHALEFPWALIILFFGSFGLLIWNEGRFVQRHQDLQEGISAVIPVTSTLIVDPSLNGKLVYASGELSTNASLLDPMFQLSIKALELKRNMKCTSGRKRSEDAKKTDYIYSKKRSLMLFSSSGFHTPGTSILVSLSLNHSN